ncbi:hypothetical protein HanXRQr2_Chr16g0750881 [Helianthus annuus]|uniref:Uncharacterized protein n=1 Tax=Helianthus annuus TaxID=4232 RepID=A0A9K3DRA8_HELAN|nr:hypothetical protein HanXRQr2_Chr16g0750881 [Helianthus annuus]
MYQDYRSPKCSSLSRSCQDGGDMEGYVKDMRKHTRDGHSRHEIVKFMKE